MYDGVEAYFLDIQLIILCCFVSNKSTELIVTFRVTVKDKATHL